MTNMVMKALIRKWVAVVVVLIISVIFSVMFSVIFLVVQAAAVVAVARNEALIYSTPCRWI
jgi:hypothetical protein